MKSTWPGAVARRIGIGGEIQFTNARCGLTLHVPCRGHGRHKPHVVDVHIAPGQNPEAVAKKLLKEGWTIGHRLMCPDTQRKKAIKKMQEKESVEMPPSDLKQRAISSTSDIALIGADLATQASPTQAAGRARRLVYMALEDYYDEAHRAYKPGHCDATIAKECGVAETVVKTIREESFGPLAEPSELKGLRDVLLAAGQTLNETTERCVAEVREAAKTYGKTIEDVDRRLTLMARKNGWAE